MAVDSETPTRSAEMKRRGRLDDVDILAGSPLVPYAFAGPSVLLVGVILAFPVVYTFYRSLFQTETLLGDETFVGLQNYTNVLTQPSFYASLGRSGIFVGGCLLLGMTLAVAFAFALNRLTHRLRIIRSIMIMPYIVSSVATALMFRQMVNREVGPPNILLESLGFESQAFLLHPGWAMVIVIMAQVWSDVPLPTLLILGGLQTVDASYTDAAHVDGATDWQRTRLVVLPLVKPQLVLSTIWLSYKCLISLGVILALTGGGPGRATRTLPMEMFATAFQQLDFNQGFAIVVIILVLNAVMTLGYIKVAGKYQSA